MPTVTRFLVLCLALLIVGADAEARAEKKLKVIASFSILGDMTKNVGGARIEVTTLVGPNGDAHVFEPTPADAKAVASADLIIVNGLGLEGWMERLIKTSGYKGPVVVVTEGIKPLDGTKGEKAEHKHGTKHEHKIDPHAWQSLPNGQIYVDNIAAGLSAVDPAGASIYKVSAEAYKAKLSELDKWVRSEFSSVPKAQRRMITSHDAFGYLGAAYGITILSPMGVSTESEPSAGGVAKLIKQIRKENITAVFIENVSDPRLVEQISKESAVKLGGELYSDALSKPEGPAPTYIDMFKNNVTKMAAAMRKSL
jgi:zinc/manganese transport system substrate-binding protein